MVDYQYLQGLNLGIPFNNNDVSNINYGLYWQIQEQRIEEGAASVPDDYWSGLRVFTLAISAGLIADISYQYYDDGLFCAGNGLVYCQYKAPISYIETEKVRIHNYFLVRSILRSEVDFAQRAIRNGADVDAWYSDESVRYLPIVEAAKRDEFRIVQSLVEHGADVNKRQVNGENAIAVAVYMSHFQVSQYLLEHGANPNVIAHHGITPLAVAKDSMTVKILLDYSADPNIPDSDGDLPIIARIDHGDFESVKLLVSAGTNLDHKNKNGVSAREHAKQYGVPISMLAQ